jgi:hypothetical protein
MWVAENGSTSTTLIPLGAVSTSMNVLGGIRKPEHTGEERCLPCTVVNLAILWLGVNAVVLLGSPLAAGGLLVVGLAAIWLRGYLVPFTPRFAPQLVAASPLPTAWFHETTEPGSLSQSEADEGELLARLQQAGVVEADEQRVYLEPSFEQRWHDEMDELAALSLSTLAEELSSLPGLSSVRPVDDGQQWLAVDDRTGLFPRHVVVAELGAVRALEPSVDDPADRLAMARPLREFLTECPICDSAFRESSEVSCCGGYTKPREAPKTTLVCPECEQRFLTVPAAGE